ncbi:hypothetical protein NCAS_0A15210 [Naumovozyma castellii]|uniref:GPI transamidase component GAB1 n=1 Tax=Naumovozyma castellii TaxID=27288 RepID=G0V9C8_NAUCA|nr:hypothetical protein NCAS_0A15210 [Naumovozyma castellii CBS 4309]CCC68079.1 hypothetical protein NCAS_0A15210 [Naumovozyma castellii CBS 4309]
MGALNKESYVVLGCIGIRLFVSLLFPSLQHQLDQAVEFSTPMTSFKSLYEGIYLLKNHIQVYDGGVVHHPVLLVWFFSQIPSEFLIDLLYAFIDGIIGYQLIQITKYLRKCTIPCWVVGAVYALNPLVLLSCVSRSSIIFTNLFISSALLYVLQGNILITAACIAIAGYLSVYPTLLLIPLLNMVRTTNRKVLTLVISLLTWQILLLLSYNVNGHDWNFLSATYGELITFGKVFPNLGLWWYFFVEMFDAFIPFFKAVFNLFLFSFIIPLTLRFHKQSLYAFVLCIGWIVLMKPYPTLGDSGFFLSFIPFFSPVFGYLRYPIFSSLLLLHGILLSPIFYHLWIDLGSGNSNFFYAISLVYALGLASILADLTWALLRYEYDDGKPNYKTKLTQI